MKRPIPKHIAEAPELFTGLDLYYRGFCDLNTCRSTGFGPGPIPWTAIRDYSVAFDFSPEQTEDLFYHISRMDMAYLEYTQSKLKKDTPTPTPKSFRKRR